MMETTGQISVVINTYNAEKFLPQVLESVKDFDEIVVCDMESTDHTPDIARQYGCRIVTFPKGDCNIVEPARQFALDAARGPWILVVDADELVTPQLRDYLYRMVGRPDCPRGLWIPRRNRVLNQLHRERGHDYQLRFFAKQGTTWPPIIHVMPHVSGRVERVDASERGVELIHLAENYVGDIVEKINRYTEGELEKKKDKRWGVGELLWRPWWRFFKSYVMSRGFLNGTPGFIGSALDGFYQFVLVAKIIERRLRARQQPPQHNNTEKQ